MRALCTAPRRAAASFSATFDGRVSRYWTAERLHALGGGKEPLLSPAAPGVAPLLRVMGLMGGDGTIGSDGLRKYKQITSVLRCVEDALGSLLRQPSRRSLRLADLCSGQSYLALLIAFAAKHRWNRPAHILAVDRCPKRSEAAAARAFQLGFSDSLRFRTSAVRELRPWHAEYAHAFSLDAPTTTAADARTDAVADAASVSRRGLQQQPRPPHAVLALHACDNATDEAIAFAATSRSALCIVAPCCQAELGAKWAALSAPDHPLSVIHRTGSLRQEVAAHVTDAMRILLLRAHGYAVDASAFVPAEHTPKNRLLVATRLGPEASARSRDAALRELDALKEATGGHGIALEAMLGTEPAESPSCEDEERREEWARYAHEHEGLFFSRRGSRPSLRSRGA